MMTDNEQRAHDIAIAAVLLSGINQLKNAEGKGPVHLDLDLSTPYLSTYKSALEVFNRAFPQAK